MRRPRPARGTAIALAVTLLGGLAILLPAAAAQASQYRYWTYWWGHGSGWQYASLGPGYDAGRISDGFVLGWRFGTTGANGGGASPPRHSASYASFRCPTAPAGQIGVALVVDFGTAADQPPGDHRPLTGSVVATCVTITPHSSGATVLSAARINVTTRADNLVCSLDGYPRTECAALVADPAPTPTRPAAPTRTSSASAGAGTTGTPAPTRTSTDTSPSATPGKAATPSRSATAPASSPSPTGTSAVVVVPEQTLPAAPAGALAAQTQSGAGSPWPVTGVLLVLAALGGGTWWTRRRST